MGRRRVATLTVVIALTWLTVGAGFTATADAPRGGVGPAPSSPGATATAPVSTPPPVTGPDADNPPVVPPATVTSTPLGTSNIRAIAVDPASGRVFVAGDDKVVVFAPDGTPITTITGVVGAGGFDVTGGSLYVTETSAGAVARIDLATLTVVQTYVLGVKVEDSVAVVDGAVFVAATATTDSGILTRYDTLTGTTSSAPVAGYPAVRRIPGNTAEILVAHRYGGHGRVAKYRTAAPHARTGEVAIDVVRDVAVSADGGRFWAAGQAPPALPEYSVATMTATGTTYPGTSYAWSVAYSPGGGGVVASGTTGAVSTSVVGSAASAHMISPPSVNLNLAGSLALAPDASRLYTIVVATGGYALWSTTLAPTISTVAPASVVAGVPTDISLTGTGLGVISSASLGGLPATTSAPSPGAVTVHVPTAVDPGDRVLSLTTPFGTATTTFRVDANIGATLNGTVRAGTTAVAGISLVLDGGGLASSRTTTSGTDGSYTFTGVPFGLDYRVAVHDPTSHHGDQVVHVPQLLPNGTTPLDIQLSDLSPLSGPKLRQATLPGQAKAMAVDDASGRMFVTANDDVLAFDRDGVLLARFADQPGADQLAIGDGSLFVNLATSHRVVRIDIASLTPSGSWDVPSYGGALAFAGGVVWFSSGNYFAPQVGYLDPGTGYISPTVRMPSRVGGFGPVVGATNRFVGWFDDDRSAFVLNQTPTWPPTVVTGAGTRGRLVASAATDRIWDSHGIEYDLSTLALSGTQYAGAGAPTYSDGLGGVLVVGRTVSRTGRPVATHQLTAAPFDIDPSLTGLDTTASRAYLATGTTLEVWDLSPYVTGTTPGKVYAGATSLGLNGSGLGEISRVTLDGAQAASTNSSATHVEVTVPAVSAGNHTIVVTTPWGQSTPFTFEVAPRTAPGPPASATATAGDGAAVISWTPPTEDGGSPIIGYSVTASPGPGGCATPAGTSTCTISTLPNTVPQTFTVRAVNDIGDGPGTTTAPVIPTTPGRYFHGVTPTRILDSRPAFQVGPHNTPWAPGTTRDVVVTGVGGIPTGTVAVTLNITVTGTTADSFATVWPAGTPRPTASSLNWVTGQTVANAVTVKVGTNGQISIYNPTGVADVVIDVVGYYDASYGEAFNAVPPRRLLDSRPEYQVGPYGSPWFAGLPRQVQITGSGSVPADARTVVLNVTATGTTAAGFLSIWPNGPTPPTVSSLNWTAGQTVANSVTVKLGPGGTINVYSPSGLVDVVIDVAGYFSATSGSLFHPTTPTRIADSRPAFQVGPHSTPWGPGTARTVTATGRGEVPAYARAVLQNVTATDTTAASFLSVWPAGQGQPMVSSLNWVAGQTVPNAVIAGLGSSGQVVYYNASGSADIVIDSNGWYG